MKTELPKVTFTSIEDIKNHNWWGNAYRDMPAFKEIDRIVQSNEWTVADKAEALRIMFDYAMGCGRMSEYSDKELVDGRMFDMS